MGSLTYERNIVVSATNMIDCVDGLERIAFKFAKCRSIACALRATLLEQPDQQTAAARP